MRLCTTTLFARGNFVRRIPYRPARRFAGIAADAYFRHEGRAFIFLQCAYARCLSAKKSQALDASCLHRHFVTSY